MEDKRFVEAFIEGENKETIEKILSHPYIFNGIIYFCPKCKEIVKRGESCKKKHTFIIAVNKEAILKNKIY